MGAQSAAATPTRASCCPRAWSLVDRLRHIGHSNVRTTAEIYSHALRGKDQAAAQVWDDVMQRARAEKSQRVKLKSAMARKVDPTRDQELIFARYFASAFIGYSHDIGISASGRGPAR